MTVPARSAGTAVRQPGDLRPAPPALLLDDVRVVRGGRTVWSEGSLTVPAGAVVGVIGPNGPGKTTLFQVALGLLPVASGRVEVLGAPPRRGNRRIGYVPQNYTAALGDAIRCRDLVTLGLTGGRFGLRRTSAAERQQVDRALARVGAEAYGERRMSELSGGQQQRVAIARSLVAKPTVLFADEPTGNLDSATSEEILALLRRSVDAYGQTTLMVTHDPDAAATADRVLFLADGLIVRDLARPERDAVIAAMAHLADR